MYKTFICIKVGHSRKFGYIVSYEFPDWIQTRWTERNEAPPWNR